MSEFKVTSKAVRELLDNAPFCKEYEIVEDSGEELFVLVTDFENDTVELSSRNSKSGLFINYRCLSVFSEDVIKELIVRWNEQKVVVNLRRTIYEGDEWLILTRALFVGYGVSTKTIEFEIQSFTSSISELYQLRRKIAKEMGKLG